MIYIIAAAIIRKAVKNIRDSKILIKPFFGYKRFFLE